MTHFRGENRAEFVAKMFSRISQRYDLLNTIMTAGRHHAWRRMTADLAERGISGPALDVASGTGDLAIELANRGAVTNVIATDFSREMLVCASLKIRRRGLSDRIQYALADAHALPLPDDQFVCATVGFGIRNFIDVSGALQEMLRVVRPGGRVVILEIVSTDGLGVFDRLFRLYFRYVTPWIGMIFAGDREAYTYLPESVQGFMKAGEIACLMEMSGFHNVTVRKLAFGTVAIIGGEK